MMLPTKNGRNFLWLVWALVLVPFPSWGSLVRIYVTNSAGDSVHVIDPATNKVVQVIKGIEAAHGINFSPDGARVYISNEAENTLDVVDRKSGRIVKKVALSGHPNDFAGRKEIEKIKLPDEPTGYGAQEQRLGSPSHGIGVSPDGRSLWVTSLMANAVFVYSLPDLKLQGNVALPELKLKQFGQPLGA